MNHVCRGEIRAVFGIDTYKRYERFPNYRAPEFTKERKEFLKAQRKIYRFVSEKPNITTLEMAERMGLSKRQVLKYIKRLTDMKLIVREGGRKTGLWRIIDKDYDSFFKPQ